MAQKPQMAPNFPPPPPNIFPPPPSNAIPAPPVGQFYLKHFLINFQPLPPNPAPVPIESIKKDDFEAQELEHVSVPIFAVAPSDQKIAKGKTCRISIRVSGKPRPFVTWFKDGEYIFDDGRRCFTVQENGDESLIMANIGNFW